jgi:hypothetical protein
MRCGERRRRECPARVQFSDGMQLEAIASVQIASISEQIEHAQNHEFGSLRNSQTSNFPGSDFNRLAILTITSSEGLRTPRSIPEM